MAFDHNQLALIREIRELSYNFTFFANPALIDHTIEFLGRTTFAATPEEKVRAAEEARDHLLAVKEHALEMVAACQSLDRMLMTVPDGRRRACSWEIRQGVLCNQDAWGPPFAVFGDYCEVHQRLRFAAGGRSK